MRKHLVRLLIVVLVTLWTTLSFAATSEGGKNTTLRIERYGIEFSLPSPRFKDVNDYSEVNIPQKGMWKVLVAKANDRKRIANVILVARKKKENKTLLEWMDKQEPIYLRDFSRGNPYSITSEKEETVTISSKALNIKYATVKVSRITAKVALVSFEHKGNFVFFFVSNQDTPSGLEFFLKKILFPSLRFF